MNDLTTQPDYSAAELVLTCVLVLSIVGIAVTVICAILQGASL